jgi:ribonuclease P protein component
VGRSRGAPGRLRTPQEFQAVLRGGRSRGAGGIVVHVRERVGEGQPRLGLVVPKAVGTAVVRNRLKRRIRVIWRDAGLRAPMDCVVVVRPPAATQSFQELASSFTTCLERMRPQREPGSPRIGQAVPR